VRNALWQDGVGLGPVFKPRPRSKQRWPTLFLACRATQTLSNYVKIFPITKLIQTKNHEKGTSLVPKLSYFCNMEDKFKGNNFPFWHKFKFPTEFELKIQEAKQI
jgi:hypothetical protein